jgi:hypothetical protein
MSVISQFFPSGSGGGGGSTNIGGGSIPVEILGISGGGGGGTGSNPSPYGATVSINNGGPGGMGAFFYASNYFINPGVTYPICVGAGGGCGTSPGPCQGARGSNGGFTSFNNPICTLRVEGGGGGGGGGCNPSPPIAPGLPGGTGGAGSAGNAPGSGLYFTSLPVSFCGTTCTFLNLCNGQGTGCIWGNIYPLANVDARYMVNPWGFSGGFPGTPGFTVGPIPSGPTSYCTISGRGGGMINNASYYSNLNGPWVCQYLQTCIFRCETGYTSNITGSSYTYGGPSCIASGGSGGSSPGPTIIAPGTSGCAGVLVIRWPVNAAGAAPPTGFPGGTNISPQTPGYYTYCFTSSGSITLP